MPMTFHSFQTAHTKRGEKTMKVFECEGCKRLAAVPARMASRAA
jgi:hypothetical protein